MECWIFWNERRHEAHRLLQNQFTEIAAIFVENSCVIGSLSGVAENVYLGSFGLPASRKGLAQYKWTDGKDPYAGARKLARFLSFG